MVYCVMYVLFELIKMCGCMVNMVFVFGLGGDWGVVFYCVIKGVVVNFICVLVLDYGV